MVLLSVNSRLLSHEMTCELESHPNTHPHIYTHSRLPLVPPHTEFIVQTGQFEPDTTQHMEVDMR